MYVPSNLRPTWLVCHAHNLTYESVEASREEAIAARGDVGELKMSRIWESKPVPRTEH